MSSTRVPASSLRRLLAGVAMLSLAATAVADGNGRTQVTVMTRNVYFGADLLPALLAQTPQQLIDATTGIFDSVVETRFAERAESLADEIAANQPDVIGVQEAVLWRSAYPSFGSSVPSATQVEFDFIQILLNALQTRGFPYVAVAVLDGTDLQAPGDAVGAHCVFPTGFPFACRDIRLTDREAILVKVAPGGPHTTVANLRSGHFDAQVEAITPVARLNTLRGWVSADVTVRGNTFRFISTHLEPDVPPVRLAQANEVLSGPANTTLPLIFVCDCNSAAPAGTAYGALLAGGLRDTWVEKPATNDGFTCCQDADLLNTVSLLDQRIDLILVAGPFAPVQVRVLGDARHDRTPSGLWPSDHAGVAAKLLLEQ